MRVAWIRSAARGLAFLAACSSEAATLPSGFAETHHVVLAAPGAFAFDPDGRLWITQHTALSHGNVWVHDNGQTTLALTLAIEPGAERGLHTIEVDPEFATNRQIWIYYTTPGPPVHNRLSRFTFSNGVLRDERAVIDGPPIQSEVHNGGCLAFGEDKTLYLGIGDDAGGTPFAQNPAELRGKLLRTQLDGTPVADNPWGAGGGDSRVWAIGLRNPYRCRMQPGLDNLFLGDVGSFRYEEIDVGLRGANFGWEQAEGYHNPGLAGLTYPIYAYASRLPDGTGAAIIAGDFAKPGDFAPEYEGDFFFGEYARNEIHRMVLDANLRPTSVSRFATGTIRLSELRFGPDGALYYNQRDGAMGIWRIAYAGGSHRPPVAVAVASPDRGSLPLDVTLDATGSSDPDQDPLTFTWDLGDGGSSTEALTSHAYAAGVFTARVTVTDDEGLSALGPPLRVVAGNQGPSATLVSPTPGSTFNAGDTISYSGTGSDPEDGALDCSQLAWQVLFHHDAHVHPFLGPLQGQCNGSFVTATHGETDSAVWYEVRLTAKDSGQPLGAVAELTHVASVDVQPNRATIRLETAPRPDLAVALDLAPRTAPVVAQSVVGLLRTIGAPNGQVAGGRTWTWVGWSDGGAREHEIATPATDSAYTATFGCNVLTEVANLLVEARPNGALRLTWDPVVDACRTTGSPVYRIYAASTARPAVEPGQFPNDPVFALVGTSDTTSLDYAPPAGTEYFLVVAVGSDQRDGASGSY